MVLFCCPSFLLLPRSLSTVCKLYGHFICSSNDSQQSLSTVSRVELFLFLFFSGVNDCHSGPLILNSFLVPNVFVFVILLYIADGRKFSIRVKWQSKSFFSIVGVPKLTLILYFVSLEIENPKIIGHVKEALDRENNQFCCKLNDSLRLDSNKYHCSLFFM